MWSAKLFRRINGKMMTTAIFTTALTSVQSSECQLNEEDTWQKKLEKALPDQKYLSQFVNLDDLSKLTHDQFNATVPGQLGFGFLMGYCSGLSIKKASRGVAFVIGAFYLGVQTLSYNGYIQIDANKLEKDFNEVFDLNKDGKVNELDLKVAYDKYFPMIAYHGPTGGSFAIGFVRGLRS